MGSIGNYSFIQMTGAPVPEAAYGIEIVSRPYVNGVGYRLAALKGEPVLRNTMAGFATLALASEAETAYKALIGSKVTVIEDIGKVRANVLVKTVGQVSIQKCLSASDTTVNYIVSAVWELMLTG